MISVYDLLSNLKDFCYMLKASGLYMLNMWPPITSICVDLSVFVLSRLLMMYFHATTQLSGCRKVPLSSLRNFHLIYTNC